MGVKNHLGYCIYCCIYLNPRCRLCFLCHFYFLFYRMLLKTLEAINVYTTKFLIKHVFLDKSKNYKLLKSYLRHFKHAIFNLEKNKPLNALTLDFIKIITIADNYGYSNFRGIVYLISINCTRYQ